jgi:predicted SnoaL-like aldol condensation-catalyzing enzyme
MSSLAENKKLVETLYTSVFQQHDFSRLDEIMRDDYIQHNPDTPQGKAGFIRFFKDMFQAMPDFRYTMKRIIAEGDIVMMYSTTTAAHAGEWLGNPPTGTSSVSMSSISSALKMGKSPSTGTWRTP